MTAKDLLQKMHAWLTEESFSNQISEKEDIFPFIMLLLGPDQKERVRSLQLTPRFQETLETLKSDKGPQIVSLEFSSELPFPVKEEAAKDSASLLHFININLYMPGFILNEADGKIIFRHINYSLDSGIDKKILIGVVGLILLYLDLYGLSIEEVSSGKKSFNEVLEDVVKNFQNILERQKRSQ